MVGDIVGDLDDRVGAELPAAEKEVLGGAQETMLGFGAGNRVEAPDAHDFTDCLAAAVVGVRVGADDAAKVSFEPEVIGGGALLAALVNTVAFDSARDGDMDAHVESREGIVAAVEALDDLVCGIRPMLLIGEGVYVCSETGGGRGVYTGDVVVDADLAVCIAQILLKEVGEVRRAKLAQGDERFGAGVDRLVELLLGDPVKKGRRRSALEAAGTAGRRGEWILAYSGTAGAGMM